MWSCNLEIGRQGFALPPVLNAHWFLLREHGRCVGHYIVVDLPSVETMTSLVEGKNDDSKPL